MATVSLCYDTAPSMKALRYVARFCAMGAVMCWFLLRYAFARVGTLRHAKGAARNSAVAHLRGRLVREMFATLGATFVKLGQVMSTRPDLFPPEMIEELRQLQDRLPPFSGALARRSIEEDLGRKVIEVFREFDDVPVAAASVAQVHRARLQSGEEVAVKVLRPDVRRKVQRDAVILKVFARMMAWHPRLRLSDPVGHIDEFQHGIIEQTDLENEARNYTRFARDFAGFPGVRFPRVHAELCGPRVLTMEFVRGTKLDALPAGDHRELAHRLEHVMFNMCFEHAFMHADLHPGNMVVADGDQALVIFDVGLVKDLSGDIFAQFVDFSRCLAFGGAHDFRLHLQRFHKYIGDVDWEGMERDISAFLTAFRAKNTTQLELGGMFNELYALARRYQVRPMPEVVLVMVGIVTAEGIGKQLNPQGNLFASLTAFLMPLIARKGIDPTAPAPAPAQPGKQTAPQPV
jgi:ubiquinone biosynthesis protein